MRLITPSAVTISGNVGVFNASEQRTSEGTVFFRGSSQASGAGDNAHVQLVNPAGSGVTVDVKSIIASVNATVLMQLTSYGTNLTTDVGAGFNMDVGGAAGAAHVRKQVNVGILGTVLGELHVIAGSIFAWEFSSAIRLGEGEGIVIASNGNSDTVAANFGWRET